MVTESFLQLKNKNSVACSAGASLVLVNMHPERLFFQRNERHDRWSSESIDDLVKSSIDKDLSRIDFSWLIFRNGFWSNLYFRWIADWNWYIGLVERILILINIEESSLTNWQQEQRYFMRLSCVSGNRVACSRNEHRSLSLVSRRGNERSRVNWPMSISERNKAICPSVVPSSERGDRLRMSMEKNPIKLRPGDLSEVQLMSFFDVETNSGF